MIGVELRELPRPVNKTVTLFEGEKPTGVFRGASGFALRLTKDRSSRSNLYIGVPNTLGWEIVFDSLLDQGWEPRATDPSKPIGILSFTTTVDGVASFYVAKYKLQTSRVELTGKRISVLELNISSPVSFMYAPLAQDDLVIAVSQLNNITLRGLPEAPENIRMPGAPRVF